MLLAEPRSDVVHDNGVAALQSIVTDAIGRETPSHAEVMEVAMEIRNTGVLVTGASRGLGLELSRALAREGARVVMVARNARELDDAVRVVKDGAATAGRGGEAHGLAFDVGAKEAVHRIAGAAARARRERRHRRAAASTLGPLPMPLLLDTDCEDFERVLGREPRRSVPAHQGAGGADGAAPARARRVRELRRGGQRVRGLGRVRRLEGGAGSPRALARCGARSGSVPRGRSGRDGHEDARRRDARRRSGDARASVRRRRAPRRAHPNRRVGPERLAAGAREAR